VSTVLLVPSSSPPRALLVHENMIPELNPGFVAPERSPLPSPPISGRTTPSPCLESRRPRTPWGNPGFRGGAWRTSPLDSQTPYPAAAARQRTADDLATDGSRRPLGSRSLFHVKQVTVRNATRCPLRESTTNEDCPRETARTPRAEHGKRRAPPSEGWEIAGSSYA
jgi:hypothetical protein